MAHAYHRTTRTLAALATATIALTLPARVPRRARAWRRKLHCEELRDLRREVARGPPLWAAPGYGWPVKPFHRPHAVRGSFGDPRVGLAPTRVGLTYSFHTGVDVVAKDGTAVYATLSGRIEHDPRIPDVVWISDGQQTFSYWHVVPAVHSGERAIAYETIVGHVQRPWGHVHFSDKRDGAFENPLRPGAMGPYIDRTAPEVTAVTLEHAHARFLSIIQRGWFETSRTILRATCSLRFEP